MKVPNYKLNWKAQPKIESRNLSYRKEELPPVKKVEREQKKIKCLIY